MTTTTDPITPRTTLSDLAATRAGASRVFYRHGLDFCCHGQVSLAEACAAKAIALDELVRELEAEQPAHADFRRWDERPLHELIEHLVDRYHAAHRAELPRLLEMARRVEKVHAKRPDCPRELAALIARMSDELEEHMQKEEQVLFPMILAGRGRSAAMPVQVLEDEHVDHGQNLALVREMTNGFAPPADACGTWRALYLGLRDLDEELMQHIHLENNVLFPRALRSQFNTCS